MHLERVVNFIERNPYVMLPFTTVASAMAFDALDANVDNPILNLYNVGLGGFLGYHSIKTVHQEKGVLKTRGEHPVINWLIDHYNITALAGGVVGGLVEASKSDRYSTSNFIYGMGKTTLMLSALGRYVHESEKTKREKIDLVNDIIPKGLGALVALYLIGERILDTDYFTRASLDKTIQIRDPVAKTFSGVVNALEESLMIYAALQASCTVGSHVVKRSIKGVKKQFSSLEEKVRIQEELVRESAGTQRVYDLIGLGRLTGDVGVYRTALKEIQQRKDQRHYMDMWLRRTRSFIKKIGANRIEKGIIKLANGDIYGGVGDISKASEEDPENLMKRYLLAKALIIDNDPRGLSLREEIVKKILEKEDVELKRGSKNQVLLIRGGVLGGDLIGKIGEESSLIDERYYNDRFRHLLRHRSDLDAPESVGIFDYKGKKMYVMDLALGEQCDGRNLLRLVELASILHKDCGFFSGEREDLKEVFNRLRSIDPDAADLILNGLLDEQHKLYGDRIVDLDCHRLNYLMDGTRNLIKVDNENRGHTYPSHELANIFLDSPLSLEQLKKGAEMQSRILGVDKEILMDALPVSFVIRTSRAFPSIRERGEYERNRIRLKNCLKLNQNREIEKGLARLIKGS